MEAKSVESISDSVRFAAPTSPTPQSYMVRIIKSRKQINGNAICWKLQQDVVLPNFLGRLASNLRAVRNTFRARRCPVLILFSHIDEAKLSEFGGTKQRNC
jgi:hypothetical protein